MVGKSKLIFSLHQIDDCIINYGQIESNYVILYLILTLICIFVVLQ